MASAREIGAHIVRALGAGVIGSMIGTAIAVPAFMPTPMMVERGIPVTFTAALILLGVSLFFTLPSALLLAAPMIWPLRNWSQQQPWHAGFAYGAIGALFGAAVSLLLDGGSNDPAGMIGAVYGAATGAAFVTLHYWTSPSLSEDPQYEAIFE
jgi:hypothetical protein